MGCDSSYGRCPDGGGRARTGTRAAAASLAWIGTALVVGTLVAAPGFAADTAQKPFQVGGNPGFEPVRPVLETLVRLRGTSRENHLCVVGYRSPDGSEEAWVYWKERAALILWEPHRRNAPGTKDLVDSRRYVHLKTDVVASDADVEGSSYKVTKAWVDQTIQDCTSYGENFIITKRNAAGRRK